MAGTRRFCGSRRTLPGRCSNSQYATRRPALSNSMAATDWLPHSARGFVSNLIRKDGQKIEAIKRESGERAYHLAASK